MRRLVSCVSVIAVAAGVFALAAPGVPRMTQTPAAGAVAYVGARIIEGTGQAPVENGVLVVQNGRIVAVGPAAKTAIPAGATKVDVAGKTIMPGMINAHGHVSDVRGMKSSPEFYTPEHIKHQLGVYARYGVTTVYSLGGDGPAGVQVRDEKPAGVARLFVAGPVVTATDPEAARRAVDQVKAMKADIVKIRVDDNLGATKKMPAEAYKAVIEQAHKQGLKLAAHIFYLQDAKDVLGAGGDYIAHSVRDQPVDRAFIDQLKARDICLCPTLMREVSTFVYESRPAFFDDPFFKRDADPATVAALEAPQYQASIQSGSGPRYKAALEMAKANLKQLKDAGVRIAMGTDTGPAGRFQGYFEHLELEHMVQAGLTPMQVIVSATSDAARCMNLADRVGTLKTGLDADFIVLARNPLEDIRNTRSLESVWISGTQVSR
jgi:imidazolonepropionase-like amidohydrolase